MRSRNRWPLVVLIATSVVMIGTGVAVPAPEEVELDMINSIR